MAYKNQNYMINRKIKEEVDTNQTDYVEPITEEPVVEEPAVEEPVVEENKQKYNFTSYGDDQGNIPYGTGFVETTGVQSNGYTEVKVLENTPETSFIGQTFFIISTAVTGNNLYQLYSDAGETATGIYVTISEYSEPK